MRGFAHDRSGAVAVMAAVGGAVALAAAAVAIDLGSIALTARRVQGAADLAALSAARHLERADAAARATAGANLPDLTGYALTLGRYTPDPDLPPIDRFTAAPSDPDAAEVRLTAEARLYFAHIFLGRERWPVTRTGRAATRVQPPVAAFSIGSRLASLDGGLANQLLSGLTGSEVGLSVMDYRALAEADVRLLEFADALAHRLGVTAGDYDGLLARTTTSGVALEVLGELTGGRAGDALAGLSSAAGGAELEIGDLIGASASGPDGLKGGLDVAVSSLDLANAIVEIGAGDRQVALDLGAQAGLADLEVVLAIGERPNGSPWMAVAKDGTPTIRTAQARLFLKARTAQKLNGLAQVELPILIELASAEARLSRIDCPAGAVTLSARPGVASARLGAVDEARLDDFKRDPVSGQATLINVAGLVRVRGQATVRAEDTSWAEVRFSSSDVAAGTPRTVKSREALTGAISSLFGELELDVQALGLVLGLGGLTSSLGQLLASVGTTLDGVVNPTLDLLGVGLGEADLTVHGVECPAGDGRAAVLVG
ncbi:MAG: TadG family pilus assembly protein [Brevundimonas sp.]